MRLQALRAPGDKDLELARNAQARAYAKQIQPRVAAIVDHLQVFSQEESSAVLAAIQQAAEALDEATEAAKAGNKAQASAAKRQAEEAQETINNIWWSGSDKDEPEARDAG